MDGTINYFVEQINRKLLLVLDNKMSKANRELIQEVLDTDLPELTAIAKREQREKDREDKEADERGHRMLDGVPIEYSDIKEDNK